MQEHKHEFPADLMCQVLQVSRSGYYAWEARQGRPPGPRAGRRQELVQKIETVHRESRGTYGSPRVYRELKAQGQSVCENTDFDELSRVVAKLMRDNEIRSVVRRRFRVKTTDSSHTHPIAPNVLDRNFQQDLPDRAWAADITVTAGPGEPARRRGRCGCVPASCFCSAASLRV